MSRFARENLLNSETGSSLNIVRTSERLLEQYILRENYAGYDPYDVLRSPLFKFPILSTHHKIRLAAQQVMRRFPFNVRPLLRIPKGYNPVTYGLCLQAFSSLMTVYPERREFYQTQAEICLAQLKLLRSPGYSGACWGYDFDWEARYARIPAFTPTIVATGIITNGLFVYHALTEDKTALDLCTSAAQFVLKDLRRREDDNTLSFSYSPVDDMVVLNATMKAARLLIQAYSLTGHELLRATAERAVRYVLKHQRPDGSWPYAVGDTRTWTDNFHTGYVLDCLDEYRSRSNDQSVQASLDQGFRFYTDHFIAPDGAPKYYHAALYPIDASSAGQCILTLCRFGHMDVALRVAAWTIQNMQSTDGFFYYQKQPLYTNKISYMRWSNAWMLAALTQLLNKY